MLAVISPALDKIRGQDPFILSVMSGTTRIMHWYLIVRAAFHSQTVLGIYMP